LEISEFGMIDDEKWDECISGYEEERG